MTKVRLIFGTTNSQPVGSEDQDIETVYQNSYKPFIRALYNAPHMRATLHFSGHLLQWIEHRHSEFIDVLAELSGRKQVELLGGGFYDPVFSLIPRGDRLGQLERMTTYLRKHFGRRPRGAWITKHIWDPALPALLKSSGIEYTFLDDVQFASGGCDETATRYGPCITEDEGKTVEVFPVSTGITEALFQEKPESLVQGIVDAGEEGEPTVVSLMFEGERLGADPDRSQEDAEWLQRFFELVRERRDQIETLHPGRYVKSNRPHGRGYFTTTPYGHIARWMDPYVHSRAGESRRGNGRGKAGKAAVDTVEAAAAPWTNGSGFFRHVLTQYHESNLLYSKMQYIHVLVNQIRGDKYRKRMAREELWRGQNHNAYWHTPNGGIYTSNLRKSVYASLIEAEKVTREKGIFIPSIITVDFDMDGVNEFLFQGQEMNAYVHAVGGAVFELDYLPKPWNYQDTMTRHPEAYHKDGEPHDSYPRNSFVDHFFRSDESVDRFVDLRHEELGDFVHGLYEPETVHKEDHRLVLRRRGTLQQDSVAAPVEIRKTYLFDQAGLRVRYAIVNLGDTKLAGLFAPEINLALPPVEQTLTTFFAVQSDGGEEKLDCSRVALDGGSSVVCRDFVHNLSLRVNAPATERVWTFPIETTFLAGGTLRTEYQATCIVPQWELSLDADDRLEVEIALQLTTL
jgi:4-alpha-glucanotransferase